jgi:hypothetical protein
LKHVFRLLADLSPTAAEGDQFLFSLKRLTVDADGSSRAYHPDDPFGIGICQEAIQSGAPSFAGVCALDNLASARVRIYRGVIHVPLRAEKHPNPEYAAAWSNVWPLIKSGRILPLDLKALLGKRAPDDTFMFYSSATDTAAVFDTNIIPFDKGLPCLRESQGGYFVAATSFKIRPVMVAAKTCDASRYLDASRTPFFVMPRHIFKSISVGDLAIGWARKGNEPPRYAFGIVGDAGPNDQIGEASIAFINKLRGKNTVPMNSLDVDALDVNLEKNGRDPQVDQMAVLVIGKTASLLRGDYSIGNIEQVGRTVLTDWSKKMNVEDRLGRCVETVLPNPHLGFEE